MFRKTKKGFKVCYFSCDVYHSALGLGKRIKYKMKKWVGRPAGCGPLAVFGSLEDAIKFAGGDLRILKCRYKESEDDMLWKLYNTFIDYWNATLPKGTRFADKVKILKEVKIRC